MNIPIKRHVAFNWVLPAYLAVSLFTFAWVYVERETETLKWCAKNQIQNCPEVIEVLPAAGSAAAWPLYWMVQVIKYVKR